MGLPTGTREEIRYLEYVADPPPRAGLGHLLSNLRCLLTEAHLAGRRAVLPKLRLDPLHNFGVARDWKWETYFDLDRSALVDAGGRERPLPLAASSPAAAPPPLALTQADPWPAAAPGHVRVVRRFASGRAPFRVQLPSSRPPLCELRLRPSSRVGALAAEVIERAAALDGGRFAAVHVRRGDRLAARQYPSRMTGPAAVARCLRDRGVADGSVVFLASDDRRAGFWAPLAARYRLLRYADFPSLAELVSPSGNGGLPDNYLLYQAEREVMKASALWIETLPGLEPRAAGSLISEEFWAATAARRRRRDRTRRRLRHPVAALRAAVDALFARRGR